MKKFLYAALLFCPLNAFAGEWIADAKTGCKIWSEAPQPSASVTWTGPCRDGKVSGAGDMQWFISGKPIDFYRGSVIDGKMDGKGKYTFADGSTYDGEHRDGKRHGKGKYTWANGQIYDGDWVDGNRHGKGKIIYQNGNTYYGEWYDNKRNGKGVWMGQDGDRYEGEYKDDKMNGKGVYTWGERSGWAGDRHEGEFKDGNFHGYGTRTYAKGGSYSGYWENDQRHGYGTEVTKWGFTRSGRWSYDSYQGDGGGRNGGGTSSAYRLLSCRSVPSDNLIMLNCSFQAQGSSAEVVVPGNYYVDKGMYFASCRINGDHKTGVVSSQNDVIDFIVRTCGP